MSTTEDTANAKQCLDFLESVKDHPKFLGHVRYDLSFVIGKELTQMFYGFDTVFHLAAHPRVEPSIKDPVAYHNLNVNTTLNVLEAARLAKIKKVIFSSSSSIYGDPSHLPTGEDHDIGPMSPYGLHKQIGEEYCKLYTELYGLKTVSLRYFNVYGERQPFDGSYVPVIGIWMDQYKRGQKLRITGDGTQTRDFVHVKDVARANLLAVDAPWPSSKTLALNVGSGVNYSLNEIASWFKTYKQYIEKRNEPHTTKADIRSAGVVLGWKPEIDLKDWVQEWLEHNTKEI